MRAETNRAVVLPKPLLLQPVFQEPKRLLLCRSPILCLNWERAALHVPTTNAFQTLPVAMNNRTWGPYSVYDKSLPHTYACGATASHFDVYSIRWVSLPAFSIGISPSLLWVLTLKSKSPRFRWASKQWWAMVTIHGFSISKHWMMNLTPLILKSLGEYLLLLRLSLHLIRTSLWHESLYVWIVWYCHFLQQLLLRTCFCHSALMIWFCNLAYWISRVVHLIRAHGISNYSQNCLTRTWK